MNTPSTKSTMVYAVAVLAAFPASSNLDDMFARYYSQDIYQQQFADSTLVPCSVLNRRSDILQAIEALRKEYANPDWDGYGANPVNERSIESAAQFVNALPETIEEPYVGCDADGFVYLEWYHDPANQCLITFSDDGQIICNLASNNITHDRTYPFDEALNVYKMIQKVAHA